MQRSLRLPLALAAALVALALAATATATPTPPKKIDTDVKTPQVFRYKFKPGDTQRYDTVMAQAIKMDGANSGMPPVDTTSTIKATMRTKTESVDPEGAATLTTTYDALELAITQNGVQVDKSQVAPLEDMLRGMTSRSQMTDRGEPRDVKIDGQDQGMKQLTESMKSALVGTNPVFPDKGLKPGESWAQKIPMNLAQGGLKLTINFDVKYTFLGFAHVGEVRTAIFRTDVESSMNDDANALGNARFKVSGAGKGLGYLYFDPSRGTVVKSDLEMKQSTDMTVDAGQGPSSIKMTQTTSATMDLKK